MVLALNVATRHSKRAAAEVSTEEKAPEVKFRSATSLTLMPIADKKIAISGGVRRALHDEKEGPGDTYDSVLRRMLDGVETDE